MNLDFYRSSGYEVSKVGVVAMIKMSDGVDYVAFACPGCGEDHLIPVTGKRAWGFNGDVHAPTITPSLRVRYCAYNEQTERYDEVESVCHLFLREGRVEFLSDCTHPMKGQTVPLPEIGDR